MRRQSALFIKPGSCLECSVSTGTPHTSSLLSKQFICMTEMITDKNQSVFCKRLRAYRLAAEEMVTQIMYKYFRFIKFWALGFVSFEIKSYSRASNAAINSARKPNHTALIILNASNTDLHTYVTVELTPSAKDRGRSVHRSPMVLMQASRCCEGGPRMSGTAVPGEA